MKTLIKNAKMVNENHIFEGDLLIENERIRVYSYEKNYYRVYFNKYKENKIVWENSYYDYNRDDWNIEYEITVEDLNKLIKYQENRQKKVKY